MAIHDPVNKQQKALAEFLFLLSNLMDNVAKLSQAAASMKLRWLYSQLYPARQATRPPVKVLFSLNSALTSKAKYIVSMVRP